MHGLIERQQLEVQAGTADPRTQGDTTDGRELIPAIPALQHRRFSPRRQRAAYRWGQGEARFVEEDDMGLALPRFSEDSRQLIIFPAFDLLVIAFASFAFGFLTGPMQALLENLADVLGMVVDVEVLPDQPGHPDR